MSAHGSSFDIFEDLADLLSVAHRIVVPQQVENELGRIAGERGKRGSAARLALQIISKMEIVRAEGQDADDAIIWLAGGYGDKGVVCTNDVDLKNILKSHGTRVIGVRDYSHLDFL
jgi:rRNA-processing protein FCF1